MEMLSTIMREPIDWIHGIVILNYLKQVAYVDDESLWFGFNCDPPPIFN